MVLSTYITKKYLEKRRITKNTKKPKETTQQRERRLKRKKKELQKQNRKKYDIHKHGREGLSGLQQKLSDPRIDDTHLAQCKTHMYDKGRHSCGSYLTVSEHNLQWYQQTDEYTQWDEDEIEPLCNCAAYTGREQC